MLKRSSRITMWIYEPVFIILSVAVSVNSDEGCYKRGFVCQRYKCKPVKGSPIYKCGELGCHYRNIKDYCNKTIVAGRCDDFDEEISVVCEEDNENTLDKSSADSTGPNTTVIVVAVCVSIVVVIVAVIIAAVYCWRVRRNSERQHKDTDVELRNNAVTNDGYTSATAAGAPRPESTYNVITDLEREPTYHSLKEQEPVGSDEYNTLQGITSKTVITKERGERVQAELNDDQEYNRINLRKGPSTGSDPSYDHLRGRDAESDYNSAGENSSKSSGAYNYGVPIKIKDFNRHEVQETTIVSNDALNNDGIARSTTTNDEDDDYVIPKDELTDERRSIGDKPRAIVTPLKLDGEESRQSRNSSREIEEGSVVLNTEKRDDDRNDGLEVKPEVEREIEEDSIVLNTEKRDDNRNDGSEVKPEIKDDYEVAVIKTADVDDSIEQNIPTVELPTRVTIGNNSIKTLDDGYETAVVNI